MWVRGGSEDLRVAVVVSCLFIFVMVSQKLWLILAFWVYALCIRLFVVALSYRMEHHGSFPRGSNNAAAWLIPPMNTNMDLHVLNLWFLSSIHQFRRQIDNALLLVGLCAFYLLLGSNRSCLLVLVALFLKTSCADLFVLPFGVLENEEVSALPLFVTTCWMI
jgi:hypothetical protein